MKRTILSLLVVFAVAAVNTYVYPQAKATPSQAKKAEKPQTAKDPVCGLTVEKTNDPDLTARHDGETYYFCSKRDAQEFKKNPEKYVKKK